MSVPLTTGLDPLPPRVPALSRLAPLRLPLAGLGLVLVVVGTLLPWASFPGFPGEMTLSLYPAGAREYVLLLAPAFLLALTRFRSRSAAGALACGGIAVLAAQTAVAIAQAGGGLVNVSAGAWLTLAGALVGLALFLGLPETPPHPADGWRLPAWADVTLLAVTTAVVLGVLVYALAVEAASQFLGLVIAVLAGSLALARLGGFAALGAAAHRHHGVQLVLVALAAAAFPLTQGGGQYWLRVAANVGVFAAAAIGLNVVVGLAGLLDLGYIAFFGVGAYTAALLGGAKLGPTLAHLPFPVVIVCGAVAAGLVGVLIGAPTLRLRGDYLAIVTLGFGEIFRITVNNTDSLTGGPNGLADIPDLRVGGFGFGDVHHLLGVALPGFANYYYLELVLVAAVMFIFLRLNASKIGRAWVAIREDETAASAMGINTVALKLLAFGIGATLAGTAGTVQAHVATQVSPDSFVFLQSVLLLAAVVLGGMGTVPGAVLGSALLIAVPEKLRAFQDYRLLLFGLALVLLMRFRPEGLLANRRRQREFHEQDGEADALSAPPTAAGAA